MLLGAVLATALLALRGAEAAVPVTLATLDGSKIGPTFDGVGAISGGGGNSRLLIDYPEPQQRRSWTTCSSPATARSLQILKVEIGGDTNSTDGAEPSIEHAPGAVNCNGGYEWWLMQQAKARNPNIKLYGLAWGAPGWIGGGNFWSTDMINYLVSLAELRQAARPDHRLPRRLERARLQHRLVRAAALRAQRRRLLGGEDRRRGQRLERRQRHRCRPDVRQRGVDIVGVHYPCAGGDGGDADTCPATSQRRRHRQAAVGQRERLAGLEHRAPAALARAINRGYIDGR